MQINSASNNPKIKALELPLSSYLRVMFQLNSLKKKLVSAEGEEHEVLTKKLSTLILRSNKHFDEVSELLKQLPERNITVNYGGASMLLSQVSLGIPYPIKYAYYLVHGFDVEKILSDMNLEVLPYFNLRLSKQEVGEAYNIPWDLVDAYKDEYDVYTRIITAYTNAHGHDYNLYNRWATIQERGSFSKLKTNKSKHELFEIYLKEARAALVKHRKAVRDTDLDVQSFVRRTSVPKLRGVVKGQAEETYKEMQERLFGKQEV